MLIMEGKITDLEGRHHLPVYEITGEGRNRDPGQRRLLHAPRRCGGQSLNPAVYRWAHHVGHEQCNGVEELDQLGELSPECYARN